jgi:hypothetical protein
LPLSDSESEPESATLDLTRLEPSRVSGLPLAVPPLAVGPGPGPTSDSEAEWLTGRLQVVTVTVLAT